MPILIVCGLIKENGSASYYRYNKGLLFEERQKMILTEMDEAENVCWNAVFTDPYVVLDFGII